ncbi:hypothetical protein M514_02626 [Trichuris suis]|uniref:Uncharacterized protein n=1 Tax=Trichuris suis TaxID=68888 RepID=A0A085NNK7_9BILA|nr:hypothetical protein M514_02626 [Trichuris suis]
MELTRSHSWIRRFYRQRVAHLLRFAKGTDARSLLREATKAAYSAFIQAKATDEHSPSTSPNPYHSKARLLKSKGSRGFARPMDLCKKLEQAESASDKIAALMAIAKMVPKIRADEVLPRVAAAVNPKLMNLLLEEDPTETGAAGIVILSRLLSRASAAEESKFAECFPSLVDCLEKLCNSGTNIELHTFSESLFCLRKLLHKITYNEQLFTRVANVFVKLYPTSNALVIEAVVELFFTCPRADVIFSKIVAVVKQERSSHSHLVVAFSTIGQSVPPTGKFVETQWLSNMCYILSSLMRGRVRDPLRWDTIICVELLVQMFSRDVLMKEADFFMVAFTVASIELDYLINLGFAQHTFDRVMRPLFSCVLLLTEAPEMLSLLLEDRPDFNEASVSALLKQLVSTINFIFTIIIDDGEAQTLPTLILLLLMEMIDPYLREAFDLLDRDLLKAAIPKMFQFWKRRCPRSSTIYEFGLLTRFMQSVIVNGITFSPDDHKVEYVQTGVAMFQKYNLWSDDEARALFNTFCYLMLKLPWDILASNHQAEVKVVFDYFTQLYESAYLPSTPCRLLAGIVAVILTISDKCSFEIAPTIWERIIDGIAIVAQFVADNSDRNDADDSTVETVEFLTDAASRLNSIISNNAHLKTTLRTVWLKAFSEDGSSNGSSPVAVLDDIHKLFL